MNKKICILLALCVMLIPITIEAWAEYTIQLTGWDLVDSGKHLDWDGSTAYLSQFKYAIN